MHSTAVLVHVKVASKEDLVQHACACQSWHFSPGIADYDMVVLFYECYSSVNLL